MASTGIDDFKLILKEFRWLSIWSVGGATVPFAAALTELSPPWPSGIVLVTSIIELITIAVSFQFFKEARRVTVNTILLISLICFAGVGIAYLWNLSIYTYQIPTTNERFVKGNICTPDALDLFGTRCPDLGLDELRQAEYEAERLWTKKSIATIRIILVFLWAMTFLFLSLLLGTFLVYQTAQKGRRRR